MKNIHFKRFLLTVIPFSLLGAAFKVMTLVEGLTEIRPVNAIPIIAGLLFGPVGALGCAAGNLIADCFGTLSRVSWLGMLINFMAAYLPWRLWYMVKQEKPNVHTWPNIFFFTWLSLLSAQTVAWMLSFGMEVCFDQWMKTMYVYVFTNNFAFSLGLALPIFIVLTSDSVQLLPADPPGKIIKSHRQARIFTAIAAAYTVTMALIMAGVFSGYHLKNSLAMLLCSLLSLVLLIFLCFAPVKPQPGTSPSR